MPKPKSKIGFYLTDEQMKKVRPLFSDALSGYLRGDKGAVFMQAQNDGQVSGSFIPKKYAIKIGKILEEMGIN